MPPLFETTKSFAQVEFSEKGVNTRDFIEASESLLSLFDLLGSGVFGFVQADLRNNLDGVRQRFISHPDKSQTVESLVQTEVDEPHRHATACLVRFVRGLAFTCKALQNTQNDASVELHVCFKRSYDEILRHHHSFVIRSLVAVAIHAVPRRQDFYTRIAQGGSVPKLESEMKKWLESLEVIVKHLREFLEGGGYGRVI
ncbi:glycolipid transfer protein [Amanita muscaria]